LTLSGTGIIIKPLGQDYSVVMESIGTEQLEQQLDSLIQRYNDLREENRKLRTSQSELEGERKKLLEKNEMATAKIEAMINRLKSMEKPNG
jgi:cell division protein ZapB